MKKIFLTIALLAGIIASAQVKIGNNPENVNPSSILDLESTDKGLLFPRVALVSTGQATPLAANVAGMTVYNTVAASDVTPGLYTNNGTAWVKLGGSTPLYQNIYGKVTSVTTATYSVASDDFTIITNFNAPISISLPTLTTNEAGRIVNVNNNNTTATSITLTSSANTLPTGLSINQYRARTYVWTGSIWLALGLN